MTPFYQHLPGVPGYAAGTNVDTLGIAAVAGVGAAFAGHGLLQIMKRSGKGETLEPAASQPQEGDRS
jgi:hypothetical protein